MTRKIIVAALLLGVWAGPAHAQSLLPASFGGWMAAGPDNQLNGKQVAPQIEKFAGDKAGLLRECGISSADQRQYNQGTRQATVTLYRMTDPTAAYGAFTFWRDEQMVPLAMAATPFATGSQDHAVLVVGNLLIEISSSDAALSAPPSKSSSKPPLKSSSRPEDQELQALAAGLLARADRRPYPDIADYLPLKGLEPGSERYVLGPVALAHAFPIDGISPADWVGFDKSAEAIVARYHLEDPDRKLDQKIDKNQDATLIVAIYPTQQIAADQYAALAKWFAINADGGQAPHAAADSAASQAGVPSSGRPVVFATRSSAMVAVLSGVKSRSAAVDFLDRIHYASTVTWNEPSFTLTEPGIAPMIVGAFLGTGSIMVLAVAAGIGFGGIRLFVKLLLPGKVFDSSDRVEILQLGLTSKPIRVGDFYELDSSKPG